MDPTDPRSQTILAAGTGRRANLSESTMELAVVDFRRAYCESGAKPLGIRGGSSWPDGLQVRAGQHPGAAAALASVRAFPRLIRMVLANPAAVLAGAGNSSWSEDMGLARKPASSRRKKAESQTCNDSAPKAGRRNSETPDLSHPRHETLT